MDLDNRPCAVDASAKYCTHDRTEPNWFDLADETGIPEPHALFTGAYRPGELEDICHSNPIRFSSIYADVVESSKAYRLAIYEMTVKGQAPNACELKHLRMHEADLKTLTVLMAREMLRNGPEALLKALEA